ncbi:DUF397 domain-containing protein [Nocardiopsis gilva YIM 90087]|uniref:DUF397 domain-containing protein n=1 Tax=Nocardiopsis gilva YIM 90087 TaxID=1235441 RepID=A0A223S258_9ACTN|nr:DUF397 domain-containing protein [Nocardiopsis gilva]ASU82198.1 DUF397 domain-containing protein [Nocardiopsis gilva YIM 90087]
MNETPKFRKSTYSATANDCVEVADLHGGAAVRDSKNASRGHIAFPSDEWRAFLSDVKRDRL